MIVIPQVIDSEMLRSMNDRLNAASWIDGNATSGHQSALAKANRQLPEDGAEARALGEIVLDALSRSPLFIAAALPLKVYPPLFNRYGVGEGFGDHVDSAVRIRSGSDFRVRSDLSATLFLSDPASYDGGELLAEGQAPIKLPAGDMIVYPASSVHRVTAVTRGTRTASFFWIQSMVRDHSARTMLFDLDRSIQELTASAGPGAPALVRLTGVYHNLLRRWAEL
ncbi:Fe2+-dependent dioxygenase [Sphingomonas crusticola]|uniref:Fe2+-dependent dioxygenase n=1 Tax=Sphingomonas crusticola TaxID=1697973 RepID=UPI000E235F84|nr:Fe2+-dependent dioxygenase [Sphingomonas crusticola]